MSYCRWSSDDFGCDLYCYESDDGYTTHVASNRVVGEVPKIDFSLLTVSGDAFMRQHQAQMDYLRSAKRERILLPHAGETFVDDDLESFAQRLHYLRACGYRFPDEVFIAIERERQAEGGVDA